MEPERKLKNNDGVYITQVLQTDRQAYLKKETEKKRKGVREGEMKGRYTLQKVCNTNIKKWESEIHGGEMNRLVTERTDSLIER